MRTLSKLGAVAGVAALFVAATAAPASAQEAAPASAGFAVLSTGHVDVLAAEYDDGELELHIHDEDDDVEYDPATTLLVVNPQARTTVPDHPSYSFLGEPGVDRVWILPDTEDPDLLFAGWATEEVPDGVFVDDQVTFTIHSAHGLGKVALYTVDSSGLPEVMFDSSVGAGSWTVSADSHGHMNWGFTRPGPYLLTAEVSGTLDDGSGELVSSGPVPYWFFVRA